MAVVWQAPEGLVWLFYLTRYGATMVRLADQVQDLAGRREDLVRLGHARIRKGTMVRAGGPLF